MRCYIVLLWTLLTVVQRLLPAQDLTVLLRVCEECHGQDLYRKQRSTDCGGEKDESSKRVKAQTVSIQSLLFVVDLEGIAIHDQGLLVLRAAGP